MIQKTTSLAVRRVVLATLLVVVVAATTLRAANGAPFRAANGAPFRRRGSRFARGGGGGTVAAAAAAGDGADDGGAEEDGVASRGLRVAYQGEPGAYSECSTRELLGDNVVAVGKPDFESCYRATVARETDYCCVPIENSLGGSIHENYDLMLRYDQRLTIVAEHEFRVRHCLLVRPGVKKSDVRYAISHPQALAQCDDYLRRNGITPVPAYDTSGSAKMLSRDDFDESFANQFNANHERSGGATGRPRMTPDNTCALASDLAGHTYGLDCRERSVEDDDSNFTRFLLLGRKETSVKQYLNRDIPSKTSVVFTLPNAAGALYRALACFSLRDIDFSKIESRPTSASLLRYLKYKAAAAAEDDDAAADDDSGADVGVVRKGLPRFRFCFYLDILTHELDEAAQNALHHLREQADFCRVLGSYPQKSRLVGPVGERARRMRRMTPAANGGAKASSTAAAAAAAAAAAKSPRSLKIGIVGFGNFGQFLANKIVRTTQHTVSCIDPVDRGRRAEEISLAASGGDDDGVRRRRVVYHPMYDMANFLRDLDVVVLSVPLVHFADTVHEIDAASLENKLVVEVCRLSDHPKDVLLRHLPESADVMCAHPMFGPRSVRDPAEDHWDDLPFVYERTRVADEDRADALLRVFERARCRMVEMDAGRHDAVCADAQFVTHLLGRLAHRRLPPSPVVSPEHAKLREVARLCTADDFDLFYGMYRFRREPSRAILDDVRDRLAEIERRLAAKEAYLAAKAERKDDDREGVLEECKRLLRQVAAASGTAGPARATPPPRRLTPATNDDDDDADATVEEVPETRTEPETPPPTPTEEEEKEKEEDATAADDEVGENEETSPAAAVDAGKPTDNAVGNTRKLPTWGLKKK